MVKKWFMWTRAIDGIHSPWKSCGPRASGSMPPKLRTSTPCSATPCPPIPRTLAPLGGTIWCPIWRASTPRLSKSYIPQVTATSGHVDCGTPDASVWFAAILREAMIFITTHYRETTSCFLYALRLVQTWKVLHPWYVPYPSISCASSLRFQESYTSHDASLSP
jgi:hypothetical protein